MADCSVKVSPNTTWGSFHQHPCSKKAVVERDGKWYCKVHDPEYIKQKDEERAAKRAINDCENPNCRYQFRTGGYEKFYKYCPFCGVKRVYPLINKSRKEGS